MNGSGLLLLSNLFWTLEITKETADEEQCFCDKKAFSNFNTSIKSFQAPHCPHKQEQLGMLAGYQMHYFSVTNSLGRADSTSAKQGMQEDTTHYHSLQPDG